MTFVLILTGLLGLHLRCFYVVFMFLLSWVFLKFVVDGDIIVTNMEKT